jgi:hypothetical protein
VREDGRIVVEKSGRKKYATGKDGRSSDNSKELSHSAHGNGMNE